MQIYFIESERAHTHTIIVNQYGMATEENRREHAFHFY